MMKLVEYWTCDHFTLNWLWRIRPGGDTLVDPLVRTVFIELLHVLVHEAT